MHHRFPLFHTQRYQWPPASVDTTWTLTVGRGVRYSSKHTCFTRQRQMRRCIGKAIWCTALCLLWTYFHEHTQSADFMSEAHQTLDFVKLSSVQPLIIGELGSSKVQNPEFLVVVHHPVVLTYIPMQYTHGVHASIGGWNIWSKRSMDSIIKIKSLALQVIHLWLGREAFENLNLQACSQRTLSFFDLPALLILGISCLSAGA